MLQLLYLDVSKVDQVLHLSSPPSTTSSLPESAGHPYNAAVGFFRIGGAARPSTLVTQVARGLRAVRNGRRGVLAEGARLRWQRGGGMGVWRRPRMGTHARMLVLFLYMGAVFGGALGCVLVLDVRALGVQRPRYKHRRSQTRAGTLACVVQ
jgi:hypothetical protein